MNEEIYSIIDKVTAKMREQRHANDRDGLLMSGEALLELSYKLTHISVDRESAYRKFESALAGEKDENGKYFTNAYCETQSKATEDYQEWQRARQVIEVLNDLAQMAKALARNTDNAYNAS